MLNGTTDSVESARMDPARERRLGYRTSLGAVMQPNSWRPQT